MSGCASRFRFDSRVNRSLSESDLRFLPISELRPYPELRRRLTSPAFARSPPVRLETPIDNVEPAPDITVRSERGSRAFNASNFYVSHDTWENVGWNCEDLGDPSISGHDSSGCWLLPPDVRELCRRGTPFDAGHPKTAGILSRPPGIRYRVPGSGRGHGTGRGPRGSHGNTEVLLFGDRTENSTRVIFRMMT